MPNSPPILLDLHYLPSTSWFSLLAQATSIYLEQHENYIKGSFRNRCHIAAVNGPHRLSIPLDKGKHQKMPIRQVRIAYQEPWQAQHWQAIRSAYGNSPFFEHYADYLRPFFKEKKYALLWDFNFDLMNTLIKLTHINTPIILTEEWQAEPTGNILDMRGKISPKMQGTHFHFKKYPQVFEDRLGFLENMSILDLLFCMGPSAKDYLMLNEIIR